MDFGRPIGYEFFEVELGIRSLIRPRFPGGKAGLHARSLEWVDERYPVEEIAHDREAERRLYLSLADATESDAAGELHLRPDWRKRAKEFGSHFAPPIRYSTTPGRGEPMWRFALLALEMGCALRFKQCAQDVKRYRRPREAWLAASQLGDLDFANDIATDLLKNPGTYENSLYPRVEQLLKSPQTTPTSSFLRDTTESFERTAGYYERCVNEGHGPNNDEKLPWLEDTSASDKRAIVQWWLWLDAATHFREFLREKLEGVYLACVGVRREARTFLFQGSYAFDDPAARVWFGFWGDLCGVSYQTCANPRCQRAFTTTRRDHIYCGAQCRNAARQGRYDRKQREKR